MVRVQVQVRTPQDRQGHQFQEWIHAVVMVQVQVQVREPRKQAQEGLALKPLEKANEVLELRQIPVGRLLGGKRQHQSKPRDRAKK